MFRRGMVRFPRRPGGPVVPWWLRSIVTIGLLVLVIVIALLVVRRPPPAGGTAADHGGGRRGEPRRWRYPDVRRVGGPVRGLLRRRGAGHRRGPRDGGSGRTGAGRGRRRRLGRRGTAGDRPGPGHRRGLSRGAVRRDRPASGRHRGLRARAGASRRRGTATRARARRSPSTSLGSSGTSARPRRPPGGSTELFQEARYGSAPVDERMRAEAIEAATALRDGAMARTGVPVRREPALRDMRGPRPATRVRRARPGRVDVGAARRRPRRRVAGAGDRLPDVARGRGPRRARTCSWCSSAGDRSSPAGTRSTQLLGPGSRRSRRCRRRSPTPRGWSS